MPYTKDFHTGGDGINRLFLSTQTYLCGGSCNLERETYRRYVSEFRPCIIFSGQGDGPGCFQVNPLQRAERTVFKDDNNKYIETRGSSYDGAGHFRTQSISDNFAGNSSRRTTTQYNATGSTTLSISSSTGYVSPGNPSSYLPSSWILTPYSQIRVVGDGRTYLTETRFNSQGSLT